MATTMAWEDPATAKGFRRLASFSRLTTYDQWGTGKSDRFNPSDAPGLTDLVHDLAAVIDAAEVTDPVLFGTHNGGAVAALYAATHPVRQLILCNTWARLQAAEDFPIGSVTEFLDRLEERYRTEWGRDASTTSCPTSRRCAPRPYRAGVDKPEPARDHLPH